MEITRSFELKVGTFILIGIVIGFFIVFSIGDINIAKSGYRFRVNFNFAGGLGSSAPVRLSGVRVGQIEGVKIVYSEDDKRSHAECDVWVEADARIENDSRITINTLGLLGEKYLEIYPGTPGNPILTEGSVVAGQDPVPMEKLTEDLVHISGSVNKIVGRLERGEGTVGKLLVEDGVYNDLGATIANFRVFSAGLKQTGENFEAFSSDLKRNPWKLLAKPRGV